MKTKILLSLIISLITLSASAYDFEVDGIAYNKNSDGNSVTVTYTTSTTPTSSNYSRYTGSVTIPEIVTYGGKTYIVTAIRDKAFYYCKGLTSTTIPNTVTSIGEWAFYNCTGLTSITIGNSVTSIGSSAFYKCTGLTSITIPNSVTSIGRAAFRECSNLTSIIIPNTITSIRSLVFSSCSSLTSITIPSSVTSIGESAFDGCTGLTSITIPNSVISIGDYAFMDCTGLTSVSIPNSVTSIGMGAFVECSGLNSIKVDADNKVFDSRKNCNAIIETASNTLIASCKNTIIPNSVTSIGEYAFAHCTGLTSITIPNSVTSIGESAFDGCTGLTSITIPNSVSSIGKFAFAYCTGLTSITIPNSVTSIGESAFSGCTGLTSITIPNSVSSIGNYAFYKCSALTSIKVDAGNNYYDSRNNCNAIIETKSNSLIAGCMNTMIPSSVTSIRGSAFEGCSGLTSINIPNSVSSIGKYAFSWCSSLMNFYSYRPTPPETGNDKVFTDDSGISTLPLHATLHVIKGCTDSYRNSKTWNIFTTILDDLNPTDLVTSINLNKKELELDEWTAASEKLIATVLPSDATNKTIKWTTSNAAVATVNDGLVQGRYPGTAYIIASTVDGSNLSDTCVVTVKPETILVQSVTINKAELNLTTGENEQLTATVLPDNATNKQVEWSSGNTAVATVSTDGVVSAVAPGNATITVRTTDGTNLTATCAITVVEPEPEYVTGDANGDGRVLINDVVLTANYIVNGSAPNFVFDAADVNKDGKILVNDVVLIANIILSGSNAAPAMRVRELAPAGNDYLSASALNIKAGESRYIDIALNNDNNYSAMQMDVTLPDGLLLKNATLTGRASGHAVMTGMVDGATRIATFSTANEDFDGNSGAILRLEVVATDNVTSDIAIDNIFVSTARGALKQLDAVNVVVNDTATGVDDINAAVNQKVNVYNTAGQLVRRNVNSENATTNLPAGLYLVGNKKVVVK